MLLSGLFLQSFVTLSSIFPFLFFDSSYQQTNHIPGLMATELYGNEVVLFIDDNAKHFCVLGCD